MWTIWGSADQQHKLADGIWSVSTPSHGGLVFTGQAAQVLSPACLEHGTRSGGYVFFEEDLDFMFPLFELLTGGKESNVGIRAPMGLPWLLHKYYTWREVSEDEFRQRCIERFSACDPDFLSYHRIPLDPDATQRYLLRLVEQYMRDNRHPELVTAAYGARYTGLSQIGVALTADGQHHLIDLERYEPRLPDSLTLLNDSEYIVPPCGL